MYTYGEQHEEQLWKEFKNDMHGYEFNGWMYSPSIGNKPADLGYFIGYKIVEFYYVNPRYT
jgi:hypothetical protein